MPESDLMDKLAALCKRRGFIFQSSEIYGGIGGFWDYGPLGVELKRNVKEAWWRDMVTGHDDTIVQPGAPREQFSVFTLDRVQELAAKRPAPLVGAAVLREYADSPFLHQCRGKARVPADVARRRRRHVRDIDDELLVERLEFASLPVGTLDQRDIAKRLDPGAPGLLGRWRWLLRSTRGWGSSVASQDSSHTIEFLTLELVVGRSSAREPAVHQGEQVAAELAVVGVAGEDLLRIAGVHPESSRLPV